MKKAIALLIVVAILAGGFLYVRNVDRQDQQRMRKLYAEVEPLQRQRELLISERDRLSKDYALQMRDIGTAELLFQELNPSIFTDVYPKMRDRGLVGVLGINNYQFPGYRSRLGVDQFNRLVTDGWGCCFIYETTSDFEAWYASIVKKLELNELPVPKAIFFPDNSYSSEIDEALVRCGIETVIRGASDGHSATVTAVDGELWFTGSMPWNYTGVNADLDLLARTNGANLVFTVSFSNLWDAYEEEAFEKTLDNFVAVLATDSALEASAQAQTLGTGQTAGDKDTPWPLLKIVTFEEARSSHKLAESNKTELEREQQKRENDLNEQIEALDQQIRELYEQWGQTGNKNDAIWRIMEFGHEQDGE